MKHVPIRSTLVVVAMLAMLIVSLTASAQAQPAPTEAGAVRWLTYVDPRFDFSIKYPSNWQVIPRDDSDPNVVSGILVFAPIGVPDSDLNADPHDPGPHIVVVPYLAELKDGQSLSEWTEMYESLGNEPERSEIQRQPRQVFRVNGAKAVHEEGVSPLTTYQYTNIAHKNMVWDIWTNIPSADPSAKVYERMVRSFRFGRNAPKNLNDAYGSSFAPLDVEGLVRLGSEVENPIDLNAEQTSSPTPNDLTNTWYSPVLKTNTGALRTVKCGSGAHSSESTGSTYYAADISVADHTSVWNAKVGTVTFAGAKNNGYGNLVTVKAQGGKEAYYAHLESISPGTLANVNKQIGTGFWLGWSGHSTCELCEPLLPHLHFHVQWGSTPMDLRGMVGFYPDEEPNVPSGHVAWPGDPGDNVSIPCGRIGR